ncbi:MAG: GNAT family N-acetyltransferase [Anaerolineae bacterium]|jgi:GNAT superfamily N-acetyltransferase
MRELRLDDDTFLDLSAEILRRGGSFQFRAHGSSMVPFIRDGDLLTVAPAEPARLEIGDVVLFRTHRDRLLAHRLVHKSERGGEWTLEMQGDARLSADRPVPGERVLGRVVRVQRDGRTYLPDRALWLLAARLWIRLLPLRRVLARVTGAVTGAALSTLESLQSLPAYRRLAQRTVGARAQIRPAGPGGAAALGRLYGQETLPGLRQPVGTLARTVALEGGLALIAMVGHRPAGAVALHRFPDDDPHYPGWWLLGPIVRARYRRAGIGRELLHQALEHAAGQDIAWVYLLARQDDAATRALAQEAGFLPATLPALQARLDDPRLDREPRRAVLGCAVQRHHGQ